MEGVVEVDPLTDRCTLRTTLDGEPVSFDVQSTLQQYKGREVRFVLVLMATMQELEAAVAKQQREDQEQGLLSTLEVAREKN